MSSSANASVSTWFESRHARCAVLTTLVAIAIAIIDNVSAVPINLDAARRLEGEDGDHGEGEGRRTDEDKRNEVTTHSTARVVVSLHHPCLRMKEKMRTSERAGRGRGQGGEDEGVRTGRG